MVSSTFLFLLALVHYSLADIDLEVYQEEDCPRNREQAAIGGRQCLRKCRSHADCISSRKQCLCDDLCGWSCVRPDLKCDYLEDIENGIIRRPEIEGFGAKVTYRCDEGFVMSGPRERRCQGDGSWSDKAPACRKKALCGTAPFVRHANHTSKTKLEFDIGFLLKYYCFVGYEAQGFSEAKCMFYNGTAQWFGPDLVCKPRSCGHPGFVEHADLEGDIFTYTRQVTFRCHPGYELFGRANIHCRENGMWSSALPTCRPVICPQPQDPKNGRAHYTAVTFQSVVKFQCRHGYRLDGNETLKCGANRTWEGEIPVCKEIDCPRLGVLHNGYLEGSTSTLGSVIYFRCFDGMKFEGVSRSTTCLKTGNWSHPLPKCLAPCIVPDVQNGRVNHFAPGSTIEHNQHLQVDCKPQHELVYNAMPATCRNGTWTHVPSCVAARCKHLPKQPKHGMVIAPKTDHNMTALYRCKDGYKLVGPNITVCNFGRWTTDTPRCEEVYCPFPGYLPNGRVLLVGHMGMYDYRPYVRKVTNNRQIMYECNRGYMLMDGPPGATCVDGKWSPTYLPRCVKGSHPRIRWTRSVRERFLWRVKRRDAAEGNRNVGRKKRRRQKDPCTPIPQTAVMEVDILRLGIGNSSMPHGTKLRVRCTKGYGLNLKKNRIRCAKGRWKPGEPKCITLPCAIPKTEHGHYHYYQKVVKYGESVDHGEVVRLNCFPGFQLVGIESLRCWYGDWTASILPKCVAGPCELPTIPHGYYLSGYRAGLTISHGSSVSYDCKQDYVKADINPTHCKEGKLLPNPPACLTHTLRVKVPTWDGVQETDVGRQTTGNDVSVLDIFLGNNRRWCKPPDRFDNMLVYPSGLTDTNTSSEKSTVPIDLVTDMINDSWDTTQRHLASSPSGQVFTEEQMSVTEIYPDSVTTAAKRHYPHGSEIRFNCIEGITGERTTWKIRCEDGVWFGRPEPCGDEDQTMTFSEKDNQTCVFRNVEPHLVAFLGDKKITSEVSEFEPGSELVFRCRDIGKFSLVGSVRRKCRRGEWTGIKPSCFGLSQENDYALEKSPTILFRHQLGPIAQSNDGKLVVYPGTILHLECLWIRKYGTPKWEVSHSYRKYPEGWTNEPGRDPQLEYRLSIYHAQKDDSGQFTCITPMGHRHYVNIIVSAVHCPPINETPGLHINNHSNKMDTKVVFSCRDGQTLVGSEQALCLPSGHWSTDIPYCKALECPEITNDTGSILVVHAASLEVMAKATFSCPVGYGLKGKAEVTCLDNGLWSAPVPQCEEVICSPPPPPQNGFLQTSSQKQYKGGDVVQFACHSGNMMDGPGIVVCQENGRWSGPPPKCVPACTYPGTTEGGIISKVKFFYQTNENVTFHCAEEFELRGERTLFCQEDGRWSSTIPTCHPIRRG